MMDLGLDVDGNIHGLSNIPFEIPYPSKDYEERVTFRGKIEKLLTPPAEEPFQSPADVFMVGKIDAKGVRQYRKIGAVVGFEKSSLPSPVFHGKKEVPFIPRPMTINIKFCSGEARQVVGTALFSGLGYEVALVEAPNFDLIADKPLLVLQPKPAQPFVDPILHLLKVGKYYLRSFDGTEAGGIWIEHLGGEGMQCRPEDLEKLLDGFWDERF